MPIQPEELSIGDIAVMDRVARERAYQLAYQQKIEGEKRWKALRHEAYEDIGEPLYAWAGEAIEMGLYRNLPNRGRRIIIPKQDHSPNEVVIGVQWGVARVLDWEHRVATANPTTLGSFFSLFSQTGHEMVPMSDTTGHRIMAKLRKTDAGVYSATLTAGDFVVQLPENDSINWELSREDLLGLYTPENTQFTE